MGGGRSDMGGGRSDTGGGRSDTGGGRSDTGGGHSDTGGGYSDTGGCSDIMFSNSTYMTFLITFLSLFKNGHFLSNWFRISNIQVKTPIWNKKSKSRNNTRIHLISLK
ncbi:unnamed protein product [Cuscuta epithymum]|uniref:Uncharacterized protein n=1 Tax=Cuscuta epithymum TaxID=186058 RepID=A0AAV0G0X2_9ASTE|nr:unnamed protein product [Cuscuta epithymum]